MATDPPDFGTWVFVRDEPFLLDESLPAVRYRWSAPKQFGSFEIDFQSVEASPERRFYPVEVLAAVKRDEPADGFAERVCEFGIGLLPEMERTCREWVGAVVPEHDHYAGRELPSPEALRFLLALFRTRRDGHLAVTRRFKTKLDFADRKAKGHRPVSVVDERPLPPGTAADLIAAIQTVWAPAPEPGGRPGGEESLGGCPMRTPLDQILVQGVFRHHGEATSLSFPRIVEAVAPALIDGIEVTADSEWLAEHRVDFQHFLTRLANKHLTKPHEFGRWLQVERGKGFVRLFRGFKGFSAAEKEFAREKGLRISRRVLWTAYEAMARCFGAVSLWMWLSFCRSGAIDPSPGEERGFRHYHAPLVCAGGIPLWFFGPNVLPWVLEPFIARVWSRCPDEGFDDLTRLIALYGRVAADRRSLDLERKREQRPFRANGTRVEAQTDTTADGRAVVTTVPVVPFAVPAETGQSKERLKTTDTTDCHCGGRLIPAVDAVAGKMAQPDVTGGVLTVRVECTDCGTERIFCSRV